MKSSELHCLFARKSLTRFVTFLLLATLFLVSNIGVLKIAQAAPAFVGLSVHSYDQGSYNGKTAYITLTYVGTDGSKRDHVLCQSLQPQNWYRIPVNDFMKAGQNIWIRYYSSQKCNPSNMFLNASPTVPATPSFDHCWFNPNPTAGDLNWGGCVNPSQHVNITFSNNLDNTKNSDNAAPALVGLSLRSYDQTPNANRPSYIVLTYKGADGNQRDHVFCQPIAFQNWYDIPVPDFIKAGQTISIRYYSSQKCNPSNLLLQASPQVPQIPSFNHCWFNPNPTANNLNWGGCVNPSQSVPITK